MVKVLAFQWKHFVFVFNISRDDEDPSLSLSKEQ